MMKRALVSVYEKKGVVEFAKFLRSFNFEILSTGGTSKMLRENGIEVVDISGYTGSEEIMDGRVKTLHPKIYAGILALRNNEGHMKTLEEKGISPIDMVVVNLYPFEKVIAEGADLSRALENIDIGGPAMLRAAAKNFESVVVVSDPSQYEYVMEKMKEGNGEVPRETRLELARAAFRRTCAYDAAISNYLGNDSALFPDVMQLTYFKVQELRYGENPHQRAALYKEANAGGGTITEARQLQGKHLSYNNILDAESALMIVSEFDEPAVAIVKHTNPCGVGTGESIAEAYRKAHEIDPVSAFGGIIAVNREVDEETAREIVGTFKEVVVAPSFTEKALSILGEKKNLRVIEVGRIGELEGIEARTISGGLLVQERNSMLMGDMEVVTKRKPSEKERKAMEFAWKVVKHVKSNGIVYAHEDRCVGIGAGQMSRVDSVRVANMKAGERAKGAAMASDAFLPFRDSVDIASEAGITAIIQPGGSIRDKEVIEACDEHGIAMVFTGMRHFRH
ncbi:MAG: bifunctional phosphoribosylaminoimidazolecarboxamide formyltransferase/IMP cyclohydrolase [Candidatus Micrarchaeia archaeon]